MNKFQESWESCFQRLILRVKVISVSMTQFMIILVSRHNILVMIIALKLRLA